MPKYYSTLAILVYIALLLINSVVFLPNTLPIIWVCFGLVVVVGFFRYTSMLTYMWSDLPEKTFSTKLFLVALLLRVMWVFFSYVFYSIMTGQPFEFGATDVLWYHSRANEFMHDPLSYLKIAPPANSGYIIYLSYLHKYFGDGLLLPRLIKAIISAYTCVLIYRLALRNFGSKVGRMAGIIAMLMPNFIYYTGLHLRETEMLFLIVAFAERIDFAIRSHRFFIKQFILPIIFLILLFFLRTVIGVVVLLALIITLLLASKEKTRVHKRIKFGIVTIIVMVFLLGSRISLEVEKYWDDKSANQTLSMQHRAVQDDGNKFAVYGSTKIFVPVILVAPFPTLVYIYNQENQMLLNGMYYVRNIYGFFVTVALFLLWRRKALRNHTLILTLLFGYLSVIASSGFALSERFHIPIVPFLIILASYGITQMNNGYKKYYFPYLILMAIIIIGWNWFKLAGRGII